MRYRRLLPSTLLDEGMWRPAIPPSPLSADSRRMFLQKAVDKAFRRVLSAAGSHTAFEKDPALVTEAKIKLKVTSAFPPDMPLESRIEASRADNPKRITPERIRVTKNRQMVIFDWNQPTLPPGSEHLKFKQMRFLAEFLRSHSTSTDVMGSDALIYGKRGLTIAEVIPIGNYAVRLQFSDGHSGGIFPYAYLYDLGENKFASMRAYIKRLRERRKPREIAVRRASVLGRPRSAPPAPPAQTSACKSDGGKACGCAK